MYLNSFIINVSSNNDKLPSIRNVLSSIPKFNKILINF
jgi:hypothetical protein